MSIGLRLRTIDPKPQLAPPSHHSAHRRFATRSVSYCAIKWWPPIYFGESAKFQYLLSLIFRFGESAKIGRGLGNSGDVDVRWVLDELNGADVPHLS